MHNALVVFHRWLALITGVLLILVALSGAVLVFEGPVGNAATVHLGHEQPHGGSGNEIDEPAASPAYR